MISCGFFIDYFVVYFLLCLLIQQSFDDINGLLDTIIRTVDTKVIIFRFSPFLSSVKFVIFFVLFIHLLQKTDSLLHIHITNIHNMLCAYLEWRADKDTDMWNMVILKDCICTSSHDQAVLCSCQFTDQIAHIKEDRIANALADKPLPVYGEGLNVRDWLYVEDHCKAIDLIIHKGRVGEVYNVGGHNEKQNIEIVKIICKELGKPESLITHVGDRKGHDMRYAIDPTKIHNELGWLPETKFEDGIKKTIQWYLDNREWWETIISGEYQNYYEKMYSNR